MRHPDNVHKICFGHLEPRACSTRRTSIYLRMELLDLPRLHDMSLLNTAGAAGIEVYPQTYSRKTDSLGILLPGH
jgi:hypothetical protein